VFGVFWQKYNKAQAARQAVKNDEQEFFKGRSPHISIEYKKEFAKKAKISLKK